MKQRNRLIIAMVAIIGSTALTLIALNLSIDRISKAEPSPMLMTTRAFEPRGGLPLTDDAIGQKRALDLPTFKDDAWKKDDVGPWQNEKELREDRRPREAPKRMLRGSGARDFHRSPPPPPPPPEMPYGNTTTDDRARKAPNGRDPGYFMPPNLPPEEERFEDEEMYRYQDYYPPADFFPPPPGYETPDDYEPPPSDYYDYDSYYDYWEGKNNKNIDRAGLRMADERRDGSHQDEDFFEEDYEDDYFIEFLEN